MAVRRMVAKGNGLRRHGDEMVGRAEEVRGQSGQWRIPKIQSGLRRVPMITIDCTRTSTEA